MLCLYCKKAETCKRNKANVKMTCTLFEEDSQKKKEIENELAEKRKFLEEKFKGNPVAENLMNLYDNFGIPKEYK